MVDLLERYNGAVGRETLWRRWPELLGASELTIALLMAHDAGVYDDANKIQAAKIAQAFRIGLGYVQDTGVTNISIGEQLALLRLKRAFRDAHLILGWPYGRVATDGAQGLSLTGTASNALLRLLHYDPLRDFDAATQSGRYAGVSNNLPVVLADIGALVSGTRTRP